MAPIQNARRPVATPPKAPLAPPSTPPAAAAAGGESKSGKVKTWVDSKNPLLPKDGYLRFEHKKQGFEQMPTSITLEGGKKATAQEIELPGGGKAYLIKSGKESVIAVPLGPGSGGAMRFYEASTNQQGPNDFYVKNQRFSPVFRSEAQNLGSLFSRAHQLANTMTKYGDPAITSPADLAAAKKARDVGASAGVAKAVDGLVQASAASRTQLAAASVKMAAALKDLGPALQEGVIVNQPNAKGEVTFEIARAPDMNFSEHKKLQERFGDRLNNLTNAARVVERDLNRATALREGNAADLMKQVNSGPFLASLEQLKPAARMEKINQIAAQVAGTRAGGELARDLFEFHPGKQSAAMGQLTPSTELGKLLFKDVYKDPAAVTQLKGLAVNLSSQLPGTKYDKTERLFEISLGKALTPAEQHASFQLSFAKPDQLQTGKGFDQYGDVADLLSAVGEGAEKLAMPKSKAAFNAGAAIVATYQLMDNIADLAKKPTIGKVVDVAEDATRGAGAWAALLSKEHSTFSKVGKHLGLASDVIGLVKDLHAWNSASSPEKKYDGFVNSYASALIIAGTLASATPWGVAAQVVGLGIKLMREETSESYDEAHRTLKQATKTPAEKAAEAAALQADYERRSNKASVGNKI